MSELDEHLTDVELSYLADSEGGMRHGEHLGQCADCQNRAAEYRWLQEQVECALETAAEGVPLSRPRWRAVRRGVRAERRRRVTGWRASAVGSGVLAICVMLSLSSALGVAVAQTVYPSRATVPDPSLPAASESAAPSPATPTPLVLSEEESGAGSPTPVLLPLPTPAVEPEM